METIVKCILTWVNSIINTIVYDDKIHFLGTCMWHVSLAMDTTIKYIFIYVNAIINAPLPVKIVPYVLTYITVGSKLG